MPTRLETNGTRAMRAATAIDAHAHLLGTRGEDVTTNVTDLLTDTMHLCDQTSGDFNAAMRMALSNFTAEKAGEE